MKYTIILFVLFAISCSTTPEKGKIENSVGFVNTNGGEPAFFQISETQLGLSWVETDGDKSVLKYTVHENNNWAEPKLIAQGNDWFVNWADFPGVVVNEANWLAWILQKSDSAMFAYDVMITQSVDMGNSWSTPKKLHSDSTFTEHGFVSAVPAHHGFQLIWLDGRNTGGGSHDAHGAVGSMSLRSASVDFNGEIANRQLLDEQTCDCCQTSLVNRGDDNFIALYRDRSNEEIRDIAVVNFDNDGTKSKPQVIHNDNWHIAGCPVNGPRAVVNGNEIGVAWHTMSEDVSKVQFATSIDGDITYSKPFTIDSTSLGRVDILAKGGVYYVSYIAEVANETVLKIAEIGTNRLTNTTTISTVSSSRKTGFPRMTLVDNGILITYTDADASQVIVKHLKF